jgi:DNA-binding NtrC family response regulator
VPCNILLVEDEPLSRRNIALFLQNFNHNVHEAETGEAALDLISQIKFDSVISDFRLSGRVNGIDVLKRQQRTSPGKPLILITAFGSDQIQSDAQAMGAIYLEKPLSLGRLLDCIEARP